MDDAAHHDVARPARGGASSAASLATHAEPRPAVRAKVRDRAGHVDRSPGARSEPHRVCASACRRSARLADIVRVAPDPASRAARRAARAPPPRAGARPPRARRRGAGPSPGPPGPSRRPAAKPARRMRARRACSPSARATSATCSTRENISRVQYRRWYIALAVEPRPLLGHLLELVASREEASGERVVGHASGSDTGARRRSTRRRARRCSTL